MKNYFLSFVIALLFVNVSFGQAMIKTVDKTMSLGNKNTYFVEVEGLEQKDLEKSWEEFSKSYGKSKYNKKAKENVILDAKIPMINGQNPIGLYAVIEGNKNMSTIYTWYDLGTGFANPKESINQDAGIKTFLNDFWIFSRKKAVSMELEGEEKKQKDLEKDQSKLENKNKELHDEIAKLKEKIRQAEIGIEQNLKDQDNKKVEIATQKKAVEKVVERLNNLGKTTTEVKKN